MKKSKLNLIKKSNAYDVTLYQNGVVKCGGLTLRGDFALGQTYTLDRSELTKFISGLTTDIAIGDSDGLAFNGMKYALPYETSEEFYGTASLEAFAEVEADSLKDSLKVILPIVKNANDTIPIIQTVHFEGIGANIRVVGCDGYRLVREAMANYRIRDDFVINLPLKSAELLYSLIEKDRVFFSESCIWSRNFRLDFEGVTENYIDWETFYKTEGTDRCQVAKSDLVQALKTVKPLCKDGKHFNAVKLDFTKEGLKLTPHRMDTTITVPYIFGENPTEFTTHLVNPSYLLDFVGNMSRYVEKVTISKARPLDPMYFAEFFILPMKENT